MTISEVPENIVADSGISDQDWQKTFDLITDFVFVLDRDFRIVKANKALTGYLGKDPAALVGKFCYEVMHGRASHWDGCPHEHMMREKKAVTLMVDDPHIGIPLLITASPILDPAGNLIGSVHVARDVSPVKKIQDDLAARNQQLEALNRLTCRAIAGRNLKEVAQIALECVVSVFSPDLALFYTVSGGWLTLQGVVPSDEEHLNERKKVGDCLCGSAVEQRISLFSEDIHRDVRCTLTECKEAGIRSFAALPIIYNKDVIGVLGIASKKEKKYADQQAFLETMAATVAIVSQNAILIEKISHESDMLEQKVIERTRELEEKNAELERFNKLFVDREFRIKELKDRVKALEQKAVE